MRVITTARLHLLIWRLRLAERAVDRPWTPAASGWIDRLLVGL